MNSELLDIAIIVSGLAVAFYMLYRIVLFINSRPDIVALFSLASIVFGGVGIMFTDNVEQGVALLTLGILFLFIAAFSHRREAKS